MPKPGYVYIMTSHRDGTLYVGATSDLPRRVWEHRNAEVPGFSRCYGLTSLAYFEVFDDLQDALERERKIKKWRRRWKIDLIESLNPDWADLYDTIL
jgi:putative endonuclease